MNDVDKHQASACILRKKRVQINNKKKLNMNEMG